MLTSPLSSSASFFPELLAEEQARREADYDLQRHIAIINHVRAMRACWPEWHGPRVQAGANGRCQVHGNRVWNETLSQWADHHGAWCRIIWVSDSHEEINVIIDYGPHEAVQALPDEGQVLRLHITQVWPPIWRLAPGTEPA